MSPTGDQFQETVLIQIVQYCISSLIHLKCNNNRSKLVIWFYMCIWKFLFQRLKGLSGSTVMHSRSLSFGFWISLGKLFQLWGSASSRIALGDCICLPSLFGFWYSVTTWNSLTEHKLFSLKRVSITLKNPHSSFFLEWYLKKKKTPARSYRFSY